ncbi:MAG: hypothetical protein SFW35_03060 [Chitinophagales bacterium]|nr:hypothetical protein [Chitinophagales bacterium]
MKKSVQIISLALGFTFAVLLLGYLSFGFWTTMIFTSGFLGGFILWLLFPSRTDYSSIKLPYFLTFLMFIVHRVEEKVCGFFSALSEITKVPTPDILSWQIILLVMMSVAAWLLIPYLVKRKYEFGYYLTWTFFAAMGITELAHFIFPFFVSGPYGYFPGMASVVILAPLAWWGIWRLTKPLVVR